MKKLGGDLLTEKLLGMVKNNSLAMISTTKFSQKSNQLQIIVNSPTSTFMQPFKKQSYLQFHQEKTNRAKLGEILPSSKS